MTHFQKKLIGFAASLGIAATLAAPAVTLAVPLNTNDLGVSDIGNSVNLSPGDVRQTAARIINVALGFLGIIAVVIVLIGGFKYMIAGGSEDKTTEARKLIVSGIIGLAIILSAWAITSFVISKLVTATQEV